MAMLAGSEAEGTVLFKEARNLRKEIPWATERTKSNLKEADFDELVVFWSR